MILQNVITRVQISEHPSMSCELGALVLAMDELEAVTGGTRRGAVLPGPGRAPSATSGRVMPSLCP